MKQKIYTLLLLLGVIGLTGCVQKINPTTAYEQSDIFIQSMKPVQESRKDEDWISISGTSSFFIALKKNGKLWTYGSIPWQEYEGYCGTSYLNNNSPNIPKPVGAKLKRLDYFGTWSEAYTKNNKIIAKERSGQWLVLEENIESNAQSKLNVRKVSKEDALNILKSKEKAPSIEVKIETNGTLWMRAVNKKFKQERSYANDWESAVVTYYSSVVFALKKDGTLWWWLNPKLEKNLTSIEVSTYEK